ncbi:hypothetical protein [Shewanella acanthi]|uniref:hypothetical protein n=1 Tax=Shewanella acanthi TaxID=2864212 RepID=UPI001C65B736|nr:hypothetical protein [Shewanella acanthi]QYJ80335.1 hypothetical protein K0H61_08155 [Shewanella acanthi]
MKLLFALMSCLLPSLVWAHSGHGGVGLFHHLLDFAPAMVLVLLVVWVGIWAKNKK